MCAPPHSGVHIFYPLVFRVSAAPLLALVRSSNGVRMFITAADIPAFFTTKISNNFCYNSSLFIE